MKLFLLSLFYRFDEIWKIAENEVSVEVYLVHQDRWWLEQVLLSLLL